MWYCLDGKIKEQLQQSTDRRPTDFLGNCSSNLPFGPYVPTYHQGLTSRLGFWNLSCINLWLWWFCIWFRLWSRSIGVFRFRVIFRAVFRFFIDPNDPLLDSSLISFDFNLTKRVWKKEEMVRGVGGGRLFEGGDNSRDGYYSRKYGKQFLSWMF